MVVGRHFEIDACHNASQSCAWTNETKIVPGKKTVPCLPTLLDMEKYQSRELEMDMEKYHSCNKVTAIGPLSGYTKDYIDSHQNH